MTNQKIIVKEVITLINFGPGDGSDPDFLNDPGWGDDDLGDRSDPE